MPSSPSPAPRYVLIGTLLVALLLLFAWVRGVLSPARISGDKITDALQGAAGKIFPGYRRAHAKGVCVAGSFASNGAGAALSEAALLAAGQVPVMGRFSIDAKDPTAPDAKALFHALGLRFVLPRGEEWRMALDQTPIFIVSTPQDFLDLQLASQVDPATGKPDPAKVPAFIGTHPETRAFLDFIKAWPVPSSFANGTYYSIHAFRVTNAQGQAQMVRWQFEPETPFTALDPATLGDLPPNFLFDELLGRMTQGPLRWHLILIAANPGDPTSNATVQWQGEHRRIDAGVLTLDHASTEAEGACVGFNFDPTILPRGVAISDDPLLPARSAVYSASFRRRSVETMTTPDAITAEHKGYGPGATP
jgi:catalase